MASWSTGLPPAALERIERQRASGATGSLLSAPAAAAIQAAGLAPVGEVFGCLVMNLGWNQNGCGLFASGFGGQRLGGGFGGGGGFGFGPGQMGNGFGPGQGGFGFGGGFNTFTTPITTSSQHGGTYGFGPYARSFEHAFTGALDRMLAEAQALGADGVVGVTTGRARLEGRAWEFTAMGTAVRITDASMAGPSRETPWAAGLSAEDCAAAILSGFVPRGIVLGLSIATKHEDWQIKQERSAWTNTEISGMTGLVQAARSDARERLAVHAGRFGGGRGELVVTGMALHEFETPCGEEQDLHAESEFVGTVLELESGPARRRRATRASPLTSMIPLTGATQRDSARRL